MRIFITGGTGQLGRALRRQFAQEEIVSDQLPRIDIQDKTAVFAAIGDTKPDIVLHCAAMTDVDGCALEPERAYQVNGLGSQNVALACQANNAAMLHISSNEVFSGVRLDGYEEWMPLDPINPYGRSKAAGEYHVQSLLSRFYIVRTAWLYAAEGKNFVHSILRNARQNGRLQVVTDEIGNPTSVADLAQAIAQLVQTEQYGTYHLVNEGNCSRWAFANEIVRLNGLDSVSNAPILQKMHKRPSQPPSNAYLHNIAGAAMGIRMRPWREALADFFNQG